MKKTLLIFLLFIVCIPLFSQTVDVTTAEKAALQKIAGTAQKNIIIGQTDTYYYNGDTPLFYFFRLSPSGYVVVAADYQLPPVIAYSYTNNADPEGQLLQLLRSDIRFRMQALPQLPATIKAKRKAAWEALLNQKQFPKTEETFLLKSNWHQDAPYNQFCPLDPQNGSRSIAGCPAVAMGQIVNYHQTTNDVIFSDQDDYYHNYDGRKYWIDNDYVALDFPSFPMLNAYLDTLETHYINQQNLTNNDMAAMTFACAVAAKQVFTSSGSGTFGVSQALDAYLKFNFSTAKLLTDSDTNVYAHMAENIENALPVHLAVVDPAWSSGHNVVVDGHNADNYFHLNFGWGGYSNGWYLLPDEFPYGLTVLEGVVVDIIPIPIIAVTSPNGGENWQVGSAHNITWTSSGVTNVKIEYTTNNGSTWSTIVGNTPASSGTYSWTVPNTPSAQCKIRISDVSNSSVFDVSDNVFTIHIQVANPTLTIENVNSSDLGPVTVPVHATALNNLGSFQFSISYNPAILTYVDATNWYTGITAVTINSSIPGKISFVWAADAPITIPDNTFFELKFTAIDYGTSTIAWTDDPTPREFGDFDGNIFVPTYINGIVNIGGQSSLLVNTPNGGENWQVGSAHNITWTNSGVTNVKIECTTNNGSTWSTVVSSTPASTGTYSWTIPNLPSAQCKVRISDVSNSSVFDVSDNVFTIHIQAANPTLTIENVNSSDLGPVTVPVHANNIVNLGAFQFTIDYDPSKLTYTGTSNWYTGISAVTVGNPFAGKITFVWAADDQGINITDNTFFEINFTATTTGTSTVAWSDNPTPMEFVDYGGNIFVPTYINGTVNIGGQSSILVNAPNGGENWQVGSAHNITWTSSGVTNVKIEYTTNNGSTWSTVVSSTPASSGTYSWTIPYLPSAQCKVRISDVSNSSVVDESDNVFTISPTPTITVTSPNGGENWQVGSVHNITWTSSGVTNVKIEYSINNGSSWSTIVGNTPASSGTYSWTVPNTPSAQCKIRISDVSNSSVFDVSDNVFTISPITTIVLTSPNGGENWQVGSVHNITWTNSGVTNVKIEYSINNGSTWSTIIGSTPASYGTYSWTIPNAPSTQCKVRISDMANSSVFDISDNVFTIHIQVANPTLTIENVNSTAIGHVTVPVHANNIDNLGSFQFTIEFDPTLMIYDSISNWFSGINSVTVGNPAAGKLSFVWAADDQGINLPDDNFFNLNFTWLGSASTSTLVWNDNPTPREFADYDGNIFEPTYINGSVTGATGYFPTVTIADAIFENPGTFVLPVNAKNIYNMGSFQFTIEYDPALLTYTGTSNWYTGIDAVTVGNPSSGHITFVWAADAQGINITDNKFFDINFIAIDYGISNISWGDNPTPREFGDFSGNIFVPTYINGSVNIGGQSSLLVNTPNGGENWQVGSAHNITWTSSGVTNVKIECTTNNGSTWSTVVSSTPASSGTYFWTIPYLPSAQCKVRISDVSNSSVVDESDNVFTISIVPTITLTSPNGGENWQVGSAHNITWTSSGVTNVKIECTTNNGSTWSTVVSSTPASTGTYSWTIPNLPSAQCKVRISDVSNSSVVDVSDNVFTISPITTIVLTSPNGGENWQVGTSQDISWTSSGVTNVKIEYTTNNGSTWSTVVGSTPASSGTYSWTIPNTPSTQCKVRISDVANSSLFDVSDNVFTISPAPTITVTSPNGGENWQVGMAHYITWTSSMVTNIKIEYTTNNGSTWSTVVGSTPASSGTYYWTIPNTPSTQCKVRISDVENSYAFDESNNVFTLSTSPSITVTSPNRGENWQVGSVHNITWTSSGVTNVKIEYTIYNDGSTWSTVVGSTPASSGIYSWTIPDTPSAQCKVRISDVANSSVLDVSDNVFAISQAPTITVTSPNGGENWQVGSTHNIIWTSSGITNVKIEYTANNGSSWSTVVGSTPASSGVYSWSIPNTLSTQCKVRISDVENSSVLDESDNPFSISFNYPATVDLTHSFNFGSATQSSDYKIIGLPGDVNTPVSQYLTGNSGKDWNVYWDNGASENYLLPWDGSSTFNFTPGRAFWIISKNAMNVSGSISPVALDGNNFYSIPLHQGWNLISDPFETAILWQNVRSLNRLPDNSLIYTWNNSWSNPASMSPFEGYYFNNTSGLSNMVLPYQPGATRKSDQIIPYVSPKHLKLGIEGSAAYLIAAFDNNSSSDFDDKDYYAPPSAFAQTDIRLINPDLSVPYKQLFIEHRPWKNEGEAYQIRVKNNTGTTLRLFTEGINNFPSEEIVLINPAINHVFDLKTGESPLIISKPGDNEFILLIGSKNFITKNTQSTWSDGFLLYQNYPNPVKEATVIGYSLPVNSQLNFFIYNNLGQQVYMSGGFAQDEGYYEFPLEKGNFKPGIYTLMMIANPINGKTVQKHIKIVFE